MDDIGARLIKDILGSGERVVELQRALTAIPALGPENGGQGEMEKAGLICGWLESLGIFELLRFDSPDPRVESGRRPNIVALLNGSAKQKLWLFGHMDVVPPGDLGAWSSDPWTLRRDGDLIFGRGVEDNQQALASMLVLAESLARIKAEPARGLGLVFMADEECGSGHGLGWLLDNASGLFSPDDLYIVPDGGSRDAADVELAEKAQLWLKFTVTGKQCHGSMPQNGKNAFVAASSLVLALCGLGGFFPQKDSMFNPPGSTFVPSRHEENVPGINILPGKDIFYMDCRLLPQVSIDMVMRRIRMMTAETASAHGVDIDVEIVQSQPASSADPHCPALAALSQAIAAVYGKEARPVGIGGATVAALLRARGLPAIVWSCIENTCHQPDERSSISSTCRDAAVFAHVLLSAMPGTISHA